MTGILIIRTQSHTASIHGSLYSDQTSFIRCTVLKVGAVGVADVVDTADAADLVYTADSDVLDAAGLVDLADAVDAVEGSLGIWERSIGCYRCFVVI